MLVGYQKVLGGWLKFLIACKKLRKLQRIVAVQTARNLQSCSKVRLPYYR